ncbi:hypothetical protein NTGM5_40016 [Candidatus Nitrotoga sp. M5]|nr:hypothetical protein NTGM5_40016 [Candidatus Nitrotoga sp. M5]
MSLAQFSPTHEGLLNGILQLCRLKFLLAGYAIKSVAPTAAKWWAVLRLLVCRASVW